MSIKGAFPCDQKGCDYKAKRPQQLGIHKWKTHGIKGKFRERDMRARSKKINGREHSGTQNSNGNSPFDVHAGFIFGQTLAEVKTYASGVGLSWPVLASQLAELLHREASREGVGTFNHLPKMSQASPRRGKA